MTQVSSFFDSGRDTFLVTPTSKPPSKFDSIEYLEHDVCESTTIACKTSSPSSSLLLRRNARRTSPGERCLGSRDTSYGSSSNNINNNSSSSTTTTTFVATTAAAVGGGGLSGSSSGGSSIGVNSDVNHQHAASCWRAEVSRGENKPATAPSSFNNDSLWAEGVNSSSISSGSFKTPSGLPKNFYWGPKVARERQETERNIRRTNKGEPATFAM